MRIFFFFGLSNRGTPMRNKGKIKTWIDDKGFGFITPLAGGPDVFVHINAFGSQNRRPDVGDVVTYVLSSDARGRPRAADVRRSGDRPLKSSQRPRRQSAVLIAVIYLAMIGVATYLACVPRWILVLYLASSTMTFLVYAFDKSAARRGAWRVQESTLHMLSLIGGWPGALIAQEKLRHKSRKRSFRIVFRGSVMLNLGVFAWLLSPNGAVALNALSGFVTRILPILGEIS